MKKGVETSKVIVAFVVNLGEDIKNADLNNDGHVSAKEALGVATGNSLELFSVLTSLPEVAEEINDLDTDEIKVLIHLAVDEIDNLSKRRKNWIKNVANNTMNLVRLGRIAPEVWRDKAA